MNENGAAEAGAPFPERLNWHIVSYPRSGNHAVRALVEYVTKRPTVASLEGTESDKAIYLRSANQAAKVIKIDDDEPVGYKAHSLQRLVENAARSPSPFGLILITRDPADAIVSHLYPKYERWKSKLEKKRLFFAKHRRKTWEEFNWRAEIRDNYNSYLSCVFAYLAWKGRPRIHLKYEDLTRDGYAFAQSFSQKLGADGTLDPSETETVLSLSRDSLNRKAGRKRDPELVGELQGLIAKHGTYDEILDIIDTW